MCFFWKIKAKVCISLHLSEFSYVATQLFWFSNYQIFLEFAVDATICDSILNGHGIHSSRINFDNFVCFTKYHLLLIIIFQEVVLLE